MAPTTSVQRLRAAVLAVPTDELRNAISSIDEPTIRALPGRSRPLISQLRRSPAPGELLRKIPDAGVMGVLADKLTDNCLNATRTALGDAADDPTAEQLAAAIDTVLESFALVIVRVMLAIVAVSDAEASDKCAEILEHDERFALDTAASASGIASRQAKPPASDDVQARRRERKEAERAARQRAAAEVPLRHKRHGASKPEARAEEPVEISAVVFRRSPVLDASETAAFDTGDPLVGAVVIAVVPFDDPSTELGVKARPCVVVGASADELLVRPGYSDGGLQSRRWQSYALRDWREAGLTKASWIEEVRRAIPRHDASDPVGRLTDRDWNALW